jgi:hypothetical protein
MTKADLSSLTMAYMAGLGNSVADGNHYWLK